MSWRIFLLMIILGGASRPAHAAPLQPRFFPETGHTLTEPMLAYWTKHGGLPIFGYPISEAFQERNADLGKTFLTQYVERNRLEAHPENRSPYDVLLGRLGVEMLEREGRPWQSLPKASPGAAHFFPTTGHAIAHAPFWAYWSTHGLEFDRKRGFNAAESLALWGYPVSEPAVERNSSGDTVLTQWFERARFEDHGSKGVLLGLLGNEVTSQRRGELVFQPVALGGAVRADLPGKIAFVRGKDTWLYRPRTGAARRLLEATSDVRWSPDGRAIAFARADGLYLADGEGANRRQVLAAPAMSAPEWAPDGTKIAFERDGVVWVFELSSGAAHAVAQGEDPAWAPDSKRIAYVTAAEGDRFVGRNQLRIVNWLGQNDWVVVRDLPPNTPKIGVPGDEPPRSNLAHLMMHPFWDSAGAAIYVPAFVTSQIETEFYIWERADATNGGSTFLGQLRGGHFAVPSPDHQVVLLGVSSASSARWFEARSIGDDSAVHWAEPKGPFTEARIMTFDGPDWSPNGKAVAFYSCQIPPPTFPCTLEVLTPRGSATLLPAIFDTPVDQRPAPPLDWAPDE